MLADAGLDRLAWHLVAEQPFKHPRTRHQRGPIYTGLNAHLMQHMDKVLAADVARRAGRERAAADPAGAGVEALDASLHRRQDIREASPARAVRVQSQL